MDINITQESLNITKYARGAFGETPKCNVGILAGNASIGLGRQISLYEYDSVFYRR